LELVVREELHLLLLAVVLVHVETDDLPVAVSNGDHVVRQGRLPLVEEVGCVPPPPYPFAVPLPLLPRLPLHPPPPPIVHAVHDRDVVAPILLLLIHVHCRHAGGATVEVHHIVFPEVGEGGRKEGGGLLETGGGEDRTPVPLLPLSEPVPHTEEEGLLHLLDERDVFVPVRIAHHRDSDGIVPFPQLPLQLRGVGGGLVQDAA